jgi:drug/metabolite transporter (DMT)-like permease
MSPSGLLLLLLSACLHVVTHISLKRSGERVAFVWWMLVWAGVIFSPIVIFGWRSIPPLGLAVMLASSVFEALYFVAIAEAYRGADLSVVYPLARGTGPILLVVWSLALLREHLSLGGVAGVAMIALGLYMVNLPRLGAWREPLRALRDHGPRWAILAGACISAYTAIDKVGIGIVDPLLYTYLALWFSVVWLTPWTMWKIGWGNVVQELRLSRWITVLAGFTTLAAYALVLLVMRQGTPASYAGAVREVSVVFGAAFGVLVLKENGGSMRILAAGIVAAGVAAIAVLG